MTIESARGRCKRLFAAGGLGGRSIRGKLLASYVVTSAVLLVVVLAARAGIERSVLEVNEGHYSALLIQTAEMIDYQLRHYQQLSEAISRNPMLRFHMKQIMDGDKIRSVSAVWGITKQVMRSTNKSQFKNIYVYMPGHAPLNCYYESLVSEASPAIAALMVEFGGGRAEPACIVSGADPYQLALVNPVFDKDRFLGAMQLDLDMRFFDNAIGELENNQDSVAMILDAGGTVLFSTRRGALFRPSPADLKGAVYRDMPSFGWQFVGTLPHAKIRQVMSRFIASFVLMILLIMATVTAHSLLSLRATLAPMRRIVANMKKVEAGDLDTEIPGSMVREYDSIIEAFNSMVRKVRELLQTVYYQQVYLRKAQIGEMQSKFNPHFLYNTLDMIYWRLVEQNDEDTAEMVVALSEILRYSITANHEFTSLRDERRQIENYLLLHEKRLGAQFEWSIRFDDDIMDCKVPCLLLQPLVENAIDHAFRDDQRHKRVDVAGCRQGRKLALTVADNGVGMSREAVERVLNEEIPPDDSGVKLGINLVHKRLQYIYGAEYGIQIHTSPDAGCEVRVLLEASEDAGKYMTPPA